MRPILAILLIAFLAAIAVFALQNTQAVTVRFLNWGMTTPLALLAVLIYVLGMLSGWSVVAFLRRSIRGVSSESRSR